MSMKGTTTTADKEDTTATTEDKEDTTATTEDKDTTVLWTISATTRNPVGAENRA